MIKPMNNSSTSRELRLLAKELDEGNAPDFALCVCRESEIRTTHSSPSYPFELIGAMEYRKQQIIEEIE